MIQTKDLSVTKFTLLLVSSQFWTIRLYLEIHLDDSGGGDKKIQVSQEWETIAYSYPSQLTQKKLVI